MEWKIQQFWFQVFYLFDCTHYNRFVINKILKDKGKKRGRGGGGVNQEVAAVEARVVKIFKKLLKLTKHS